MDALEKLAITKSLLECMDVLERNDPCCFELYDKLKNAPEGEYPDETLNNVYVYEECEYCDSNELASVIFNRAMYLVEFARSAKELL